MYVVCSSTGARAKSRRGSAPPDALLPYRGTAALCGAGSLGFPLSTGRPHSPCGNCGGSGYISVTAASSPVHMSASATNAVLQVSSLLAFCGGCGSCTTGEWHIGEAQESTVTVKTQVPGSPLTL